MMAFIIDPKNFDPKKLTNPHIIYIFHHPSIYNRLHNRYPVVLLDHKGEIVKENISYLDKASYQEQSKLLDFAKESYKQLNKTRKKYEKRLLFRRLKNDPIVRENLKLLNNLEYHQALRFLETEMLKEVLSALYTNNITLFEKYPDHFRKLFNYCNSFFYALSFTVTHNRAFVPLTDSFRFQFFLKTSLFYGFNTSDITANGFKKSYLKVLARLFIEYIHQNNFFLTIQKRFSYLKEDRW